MAWQSLNRCTAGLVPRRTTRWLRCAGEAHGGPVATAGTSSRSCPMLWRTANWLSPESTIPDDARIDREQEGAPVSASDRHVCRRRPWQEKLRVAAFVAVSPGDRLRARVPRLLA